MLWGGCGMVCWLIDWRAGCVGISLGAFFCYCVVFSLVLSGLWLIVGERLLSVLTFVWDFVNSVDLFAFCC